MMLNEIALLKDRKWYLKYEEDKEFLINFPESVEKQNKYWNSEYEIIKKNLERKFKVVEKNYNNFDSTISKKPTDLYSVLIKYFKEFLTKYKGNFIN
jgi:hypothetical protein